MKIVLTKAEAIEILTDYFFDFINDSEHELSGQGKLSVGIELTESENIGE